MKRAAAVALLLLAVVPSHSLRAQQSDAPVVFKSESSLVAVDVVVTSKDGAPPRIESGDWRVFEDGREQKLSSVEYAPSGSRPEPRLQESGWSNNLSRPGRPPEATGTTILLIDALNTTPTVQQKAKSAALRALAQLPGHERFIVFHLGADLKQVSGYTDDLAAVRDFIRGQPVMEAQMLNTPGADIDKSFAAPSAAPSTSTNPSLNAGSGSEMFQQAQQRVQINNTNRRIKTTLASLQAIAEIAARQPGRKSLIWLTSSFPLSLGPGPAYLSGVQNVMPGTTRNSGPSSYFDLENYTHELDKLGKSMSEARVAIYPILLDTLSSGMDDASAGLPTGRDNDPRIQDRMSSIASAEQTAKLTGGVSRANTNDIESAFRHAVGDADAYYTLSFVPREMKLDGSFHKLEVRTTQPGVELHYRPGFYAEPAKDLDPRQMLKAALVPDTPQKTAVETSARLRDGELELRVGTGQLSLEQLADGKHKASLLVGYVAATLDGKHPQEGLSPAEFVLDDAQLAEAAQRGLPIALPLKPPTGNYLLRAAVLDLNSHRIGSVDVETRPSAAAIPQPETAAPTLSGEPVYPELGRLTPDEYENYFFNFKMLLPRGLTMDRNLYFPIPPKGSHVLLALQYTGLSNSEHPVSGSLTVFAEDASFAKTTDPRQAAEDEGVEMQKEYNGAKVWGPRDSRYSGCGGAGYGNCAVVCAGAGYANCTRVVFYQRKGYLLKFVAHSDYSDSVSRKIWETANSVVFSGEARRRLPQPSGRYTGPAVPAFFIDQAIASPFRFDAGSLEGRGYRNDKLHLRYTFPAEWEALSAEEGRDHFVRFHAVSQADREREQRFFLACAQPLLYLRQAGKSDDEADDLTLFALSARCLGVQPPRWEDNASVAALASQLSMLHDFGDIKSARAETIAGHAFLVLTGQNTYTIAGSELQQRRFQVAYLTGSGDYLLAWFLSGKHPRAVNALPAAQLSITAEAPPVTAKQ